ncbi:MAG TPA: Hpt domain-containing protein, partial [Thiobacillus sp.]|nr:Hpt domain-containing protein [Thiobacillus sp.]
SYDALAALARTQLHSQQLAKAAPRATSKAKADAAMAVSPSSPARNAAIEVEGDEDIIQIFIEDAREMIALINKTLPDWHADVSNRDALLDLRRAFHTLKGSGRMVGASEIAEFGWSLENMLNRVREGKVAPSEAMFYLLYKARDVLPEMVVQLEGGPATDVDIAEMQAQAEALADNRPIETGASGKTHTPPMANASPLPESPTIPAPAANLPRLDATLLQIFSIETREHTESVRSEIEKCRTSEIGRQVSEGLARAAHTLQGSARAVGLKPMAEASAEIEKLLHVYQAHQHPLDETASALFERLIVAVERLIEALGRGETQAAGLLNEFASIVQDAHALQTHMSGTEPAPPSVKPHAPGASAAHISMPVPPAPAKVSMSVPAPARDAGETVEENLDPELLEIFLEEGTDIMAAIEESLTKWRSDRTDRASVAELKRQLHTLKGGARMAGAMTMGDLGHHTESLLGEVESGRVHADT